MTTRRRFLQLAVTISAGYLKLPVVAQTKNNTTAATHSGTCNLTAGAIEGPYYIHDSFVRREITEDKNGVPMILKLQLLAEKDCAPIRDAKVDVWHCDALGNYSGFPNADPDVFPDLGGNIKASGDLRFCRGRQITDSNGWVEFHTIYPGWYTPRTVHIHVKALLNQKEMITTQLYFPKDLNDTILSTESPYETRGKSPHRNDRDLVLRRARGGNVAWPEVEKSDETVTARQTLEVKKLV